MNYLKYCSVLVAVASLFISSCNKSEKEHDLAPASEQQKMEITEEQRQQIELFAEELTLANAIGDTDFFNNRLNINKLGDLALEGLDLTATERKSVSRGLKSSLPATKQQLVQVFTSSAMKFIGLVHDTRPALLYRIILEDFSFTYCELVLDKREADGEWEIVDLLMYANGKRTSAVMRDTLAQLLPATGKTDKVMEEAMETVQRISKLNQSGDYQKAWELWKDINPKAYKNRIVLMQGYMAAFQIYYSSPDNTAEATEPLLKVVSIMEKQFPGDVGLAILQLGVHDINQDSKKYREAVQSIKHKG